MKLIRAGDNETVLRFSSGLEILFSYSTPVAAFVPGEGYVRTTTKWSATTSRHINRYVGAHYTEAEQSYFDELVKNIGETYVDGS
jgi:hypothetical protein